MEHVKWGSVGENLRRLAPNAYGDNVSQPATACTAAQTLSKSCPYPMELSGVGSTRPSARLISNTLMRQVIILLRNTPVHIMVFFVKIILYLVFNH